MKTEIIETITPGFKHYIVRVIEDGKAFTKVNIQLQRTLTFCSDNPIKIWRRHAQVFLESDFNTDLESTIGVARFSVEVKE